MATDSVSSELDHPKASDLFTKEPTRLARVAKGSGTSQADVRELITQYKKFSDMIKKMGPMIVSYTSYILFFKDKTYFLLQKRNEQCLFGSTKVTELLKTSYRRNLPPSRRLLYRQGSENSLDLGKCSSYCELILLCLLNTFCQE